MYLNELHNLRWSWKKAKSMTGLNNLQGPRLQYKELDVGRCKSMREPQGLKKTKNTARLIDNLKHMFQAFVDCM